MAARPSARFHLDRNSPSKFRSRLPALAMAVLICISISLFAFQTRGGLRRDQPLTSNLSTLAKQIAPQQGGTVVLVMGNRAMNDMLENWVISATAVLPPLKFVVLPLDEEGYNDLLRRKVPNVVRDERAWSMFSANGSSFGGAGYYAMSKYKWQATRALLHEGFDVLMSDPDIVLLRNPLPYFVRLLVCAFVALSQPTLRLQTTMAPCDMYIQLDVGDDVTGAWARANGGFGSGHAMYQNTGFVFFRSTPDTIRVLNVYSDFVDEAGPKSPDDQTLWNQ